MKKEIEGKESSVASDRLISSLSVTISFLGELNKVERKKMKQRVEDSSPDLKSTFACLSLTIVVMRFLLLLFGI